MSKQQPGDAIRRSLIMRQLAEQCALAKYFGEVAEHHNRVLRDANAAMSDAAAKARGIGITLGFDTNGEQISKAIDANEFDLGTMRDAELEKVRAQFAQQQAAPQVADEPEAPPARRAVRKKTGPRAISEAS